MNKSFLLDWWLLSINDLLVNERLLLEDVRDGLVDLEIYSLFIYNLVCVIYHKSLSIWLRNQPGISIWRWINPVGLGLDVKGIKGDEPPPPPSFLNWNSQKSTDKSSDIALRSIVLSLVTALGCVCAAEVCMMIVVLFEGLLFGRIRFNRKYVQMTGESVSLSFDELSRLGNRYK